MTFKKCKKCDIKKPTEEFYKHKLLKDGLENRCKKCTLVYNRSIPGLIARIYAMQRFNSKRRGHKMPTYTKGWFANWILENQNFFKLYTRWVASGYLKDCIPSVDRIDDSIGYTKNNIQLITWDENNKKGSIVAMTLKINTGKPKKAVLQYSLNDCIVGEFISLSEAARQTNSHLSNIFKCCNGTRNSANGYKWGYKHEQHRS